MRNGIAQFFRHGLACRFVILERCVPRSGRIGIKRDRDVAGLLVAEDFQQRLGETVKGRSIDAFGREDGLCNQREVRAISQGHSVQKKQLLRHDLILADAKAQRNSQIAK